MNLKELKARADEIIANQIRRDFERYKADDKILSEAFAGQIHKESEIMDHIMVEVFDARILRNKSRDTGTVGQMPVSTAIRKFQ